MSEADLAYHLLRQIFPLSMRLAVTWHASNHTRRPTWNHNLMVHFVSGRDLITKFCRTMEVVIIQLTIIHIIYYIDTSSYTTWFCAQERDDISLSLFVWSDPLALEYFQRDNCHGASFAKGGKEGEARGHSAWCILGARGYIEYGSIPLRGRKPRASHAN